MISLPHMALRSRHVYVLSTALSLTTSDSNIRVAEQPRPLLVRCSGGVRRGPHPQAYRDWLDVRSPFGHLHRLLSLVPHHHALRTKMARPETRPATSRGGGQDLKTGVSKKQRFGVLPLGPQSGLTLARNCASGHSTRFTTLIERTYLRTLLIRYIYHLLIPRMILTYSSMDAFLS